MTEKGQILNRIRLALKTNAPRPGHTAPAQVKNPGGSHHPPSPGEPRNWLPKVGESVEEHRTLFARNAAELKADFHWLDSPEDARKLLNDMASREVWQKVATHAGECTSPLCSTLPCKVLTLSPGYDRNELESCNAGISECDFLVAQTGTVALTNQSAGGRALSVLPPHHIVLARKHQLLPDLPAAFAGLRQKYGDNFPTMISLITGPSRTGDIERILVLGAHGPKKLTILAF